MKQQLDSLFSRGFETLCEFGLLSLSGADDMMHCQVGHAREFLALGGDQMHRAFSVPDASNAWQGAVEAGRQYSAALALWQDDSVRLIERQAAAATRLLNEAMDDTLAEAAAESGAARDSQPTRSKKGDQKLAA